MFRVQCEESRINHLTLLLVVTMPYPCWFLWCADDTEDFKWHLHFQFGVAFWRVVLREVYFEGPNRVWRALKTSIVNTASGPPSPPLVIEVVGTSPEWLWARKISAVDYNLANLEVLMMLPQLLASLPLCRDWKTSCWIESPPSSFQEA